MKRMLFESCHSSLDEVGRGIHHTEAARILRAALTWILRRSAPQNDRGSDFRLSF